MSGISSTDPGNQLTPTSIPATTTSPAGGGKPSTALGFPFASTTSASTQTAVTLSGVTGVLEFAALTNTAGTSSTDSLLQITVDGVEIYSETGIIAQNATKTAVGAFSSAASIALATQTFTNSLLIEFASDGTDTMEMSWRFFLT